MRRSGALLQNPLRMRTRNIWMGCTVERRGSSGTCAPLDGAKKTALWLACAVQEQTAAVSRAMARICNTADRLRLGCARQQWVMHRLANKGSM